MHVESDVKKPSFWPVYYVNVRVGSHVMSGEATSRESAEALRSRWEELLVAKAKAD